MVILRLAMTDIGEFSFCLLIFQTVRKFNQTENATEYICYVYFNTKSNFDLYSVKIFFKRILIFFLDAYQGISYTDTPLR